jgi:hypothetical protein
MTRPTIIDFFCCSGGLSRGYQQAGFRVIGERLMRHIQGGGNKALRDATTFATLTT